MTLGLDRNSHFKGQRTKKHVMHKALKYPFWKAERWCTAKYGSLVMEYNEEVRQAVAATGGMAADSKRNIGLRVIRQRE